MLLLSINSNLQSIIHILIPFRCLLSCIISHSSLILTSQSHSDYMLLFPLQVPCLRPTEYRTLHKSQRTVSRAYGGSRCATCVRNRFVLLWPNPPTTSSLFCPQSAFFVLFWMFFSLFELGGRVWRVAEICDSMKNSFFISSLMIPKPY